MIPQSYLCRCGALLISLSAGLAAQDFGNYQVERVSSGHRYTHGPIWVREGFLLFSDTPANHVLKWAPGGKAEPFVEDAQGPAGLGMDTSARLFVCEGRARRIVRIDKNKRTQVVAERIDGKRFNAPNDIVVRRDGHAYFTDPAFGYQQDSRELDYYGIFHLTPKGDIVAVAKWATRPNGIAMNFAGRALYISDSDRRSIRVFDLDRAGAATNERPFVSGIEGVPGGLALDEKGNVYVAAKHVDVYSPEGRRVARFVLPDAASGCTFGDPDLQGLYVTAGTSVYRIRLNVKGSVQH